MRISNIGTIFENLKDFHLRVEEESDDFIVEECDDVHELLFEIEMIIYNNLLESVNDNTELIPIINSKEYLDRVSSYYLLDKNNNKIFLSEFLHLIPE